MLGGEGEKFFQRKGEGVWHLSTVFQKCAPVTIQALTVIFRVESISDNPSWFEVSYEF